MRSLERDRLKILKDNLIKNHTSHTKLEKTIVITSSEFEALLKVSREKYRVLQKIRVRSASCSIKEKKDPLLSFKLHELRAKMTKAQQNVFGNKSFKRLYEYFNEEKSKIQNQLPSLKENCYKGITAKK